MEEKEEGQEEEEMGEGKGKGEGRGRRRRRRRKGREGRREEGKKEGTERTGPSHDGVKLPLIRKPDSSKCRVNDTLNSAFPFKVQPCSSVYFNDDVLKLGFTLHFKNHF